MTLKKTFILCILDGWGYNSAPSPHNAWHLADTPNFDKLMLSSPCVLLEASGESVGLPPGQIGNSEVGHLTIGSGRVVKQDLPRINTSISDGSFDQHPILLKAINAARAGAIHLISLFSPGGVHAHIDHLNHLCSFLSKKGVRFYIHAITDGRDVPPQSILPLLKTSPYQKNIATVMGRYYAMDRDKRWERTVLAAKAIIEGRGQGKMKLQKNNLDPLGPNHIINAMSLPSCSIFSSAEELIEASYSGGIYDEFILPAIHQDYLGILPEDQIITLNFRADRIQQLMEILLHNTSNIISMTDYGPYSTPNILFPSLVVQNTLGEVLAQNGKKQLRLAETEKFAHVTFFFNGGEYKPYENEQRILIPSPKVTTYDLCPEMSAYEVCHSLCKAIEEERYDFICVNFANADMVGHTGQIRAAVQACQVLDDCLGKISKVVLSKKAELFITSDHGNIENMFDYSSNQPHTYHTSNPVPFLYLNGEKSKEAIKVVGGLQDVAPTVLSKMKIKKPIEMTGKNLFT